MVAHTINFIFDNSGFIDYTCKQFSSSNFCLSSYIGKKMIKKVSTRKVITFFKRVNVIFINIINFILLLPTYFLGVGICRILWEIFGKKNFHKNNPYWIISEKLEEEYEKYTKQF